MCGGCADKHRQELNSRQRSIKKLISQGMEYVLLAGEVDPQDAGIKRNIKSTTELARSVEVDSPKTAGLKKSLIGEQTTRGVPLETDITPTNQICHFCEERPADSACQISVPMCGNIRLIEMLFNKGYEFNYSTAIVPRCRNCRDEHRELPVRVGRWQSSREEAAENRSFPELREKEKSEDKAHNDAVEQLKADEQAVTDARWNQKKAKRIGGQCDSCKSGVFWKEFVCANCDSDVVGISRRIFTHVVGAILLLAGFSMFILIGEPVDLMKQLIGVSGHIGWSNEVLVWLADATPFRGANADWQFSKLVVSLIGAQILISLLVVRLIQMTVSMRRRRRKLSLQREAEFAEKREVAIGNAKKNLEQASAALEAAKFTAQKISQALQKTREKLKLAREKAIADFELANPMPVLTSGVKSESSYLQSEAVGSLLAQGWGYGDQISDKGEIVATVPTGVGGLVGGEDLRDRQAHIQTDDNKSSGKESKKPVEAVTKTPEVRKMSCPKCYAFVPVQDNCTSCGKKMK
jgi:uncharacterized OB-fold protein